MNILVSACLLGLNCKYSGGNNFSEKLTEYLKSHNLIPVCPEQLGGLTTPRDPAEVQNGTGKDVLEGNAEIFTCNGVNVTKQFIRGAEETLKMAKLYDCKLAILKARSPSCGYGEIYDGSFGKKIIEGSGVAAELLSGDDIIILNEENFEDVI